MCQCGADYPASTLRIHNVSVWLQFGQVHFLREHFVVTTYFRKPIGTQFVDPLFFKIFNSSLLWDVFIINSVEQLQALLAKNSFRYRYKPISKNTKNPPLVYFFIINSVEQLHRLEEGFCVFKNGLISISDWVFGNVWSCSTLFIMKTSHKNDELIKRGSTNRVPMRIPYRLKMWGILYFVLTTCSMGHNYHMYLYLLFPIKQNDHVYEK
jgi:hypothetical protein